MPAIHYLTGDIFTAPAQTLVNPVNCQGIMGKGLALAFKKRFPTMFKTYQHQCQTGQLRIGEPTLYTESTPWILNFPTKDEVRADSKLEYIIQGLTSLETHYLALGITSIAFPKLGAGLGRLSWDEVGPVMANTLSKLDIKVFIYISENDQQY